MSKETILKKIRTALQKHQVAMPFPDAEKIQKNVFASYEMSLEERYAIEFNKLGGKFVYASSQQDFFSQLQALADSMNWKVIHTKDEFLISLSDTYQSRLIQRTIDMEGIQVGISGCECLIARTGSAIYSASQEYGRSLPVYAPIHITVAFVNQICEDIDDGIQYVQQKYQELPSMISLTTGPSRTADIEKTLVVGVHGPKEVYTFLVDSMN
jgi:Uncharacterized conserved protein